MAIQFLIETRETFKTSQNAAAHIAEGLTEMMDLYLRVFLVRKMKNHINACTNKQSYNQSALTFDKYIFMKFSL